MILFVVKEIEQVLLEGNIIIPINFGGYPGSYYPGF